MLEPASLPGRVLIISCGRFLKPPAFLLVEQAN